MILAVANSCWLHARNEHVPAAEREAIDLAAAAVRVACTETAMMTTPLFDKRDAGVWTVLASPSPA